jgi:hypothetical protein
MNLGGKRVCFVSSHLAAHLDKVDARNANVRLLGMLETCVAFPT